MARQKQPSLLEEWLAAKASVEDVKQVIENERRLRKELIKQYFPHAVENTNLVRLPEGILNLNQPYDRSIHEDLFATMRGTLLASNIDLDGLIRYEPKLVMAAYRQLTAKQTKLFDRCLTIKPGSPTLTFTENQD